MLYGILQGFKDITHRNKFRFKNPLYTLDATVIDLCLVFTHGQSSGRGRGSLKIHNLYDQSGCLLVFMTVRDGNQHEVRVAKELILCLVPDSIASMT